MTVKQWLILIVTILAVQSFAYADEIVTTVFNVIDSKKSERILVLSGIDGRIYKYPRSDKNLKFIKSLKGAVVKLKFSMKGKEVFITDISRLNSWEVSDKDLDLNHFRYNQLRRFAPSDIQSDKKVNDVFTSLLNDGDKRRSECFKRAHMWSFDMWSKLGIQSQKIFIFYTSRYKTLEDEKWWFHVAPVIVSNGVEYVLDGTFMEKPITVKEWQHFFIKSENITCPLIDKIADYENGQQRRLCYIMKVPMYYLSPLDIENRDNKGLEKTHWVLSELQDARKAFKGYDNTYEGLDTGNDNITY